MAEPAFDPLEAITSHSRALADLADGHLEVDVRACPGWTMADLVAHLTDVQWFWATIVEEGLLEPPEEDRRPVRAQDEGLTPALRTQTERMARVLREADPSSRVWTWAPAQQDVGFVTRHQVQEAAVHHWDAADAIGQLMVIEAPAAADAVLEFLTFSVSTDADPADPPRPSLGGTLGLRATDLGTSWTLHEGSVQGTIAVDPGSAGGGAVVEGSASDLLLWLYKRVELDTSGLPEGLIERFDALRFTD